jgi:hypothetical protein
MESFGENRMKRRKKRQLQQNVICNTPQIIVKKDIDDNKIINYTYCMGIDKLLKIIKAIDIIFAISAFMALVSAFIVNINSGAENFFLSVIVNQGVTFFYRIAMASFYFLAVLFVEKWLKGNE